MWGTDGVSVFPSLHEQALSKILQALFLHARSAEPVKLGPLDELVVEVSAATCRSTQPWGAMYEAIA
jgi:hypothetical protein